MFDAYSLLMTLRDARPDDYQRMMVGVKDTTPFIPLDAAVQFIKDHTLFHHHGAIDRAIRNGEATDSVPTSLAKVLLLTHGPQGAADLIHAMSSFAFPKEAFQAAGVTAQRLNGKKRRRA
jgi:hypothetical protein